MMVKISLKVGRLQHLNIIKSNPVIISFFLHFMFIAEGIHVAILTVDWSTGLIFCFTKINKRSKKCCPTSDSASTSTYEVVLSRVWNNILHEVYYNNIL